MKSQKSITYFEKPNRWFFLLLILPIYTWVSTIEIFMANDFYLQRSN